MKRIVLLLKVPLTKPLRVKISQVSRPSRPPTSIDVSEAIFYWVGEREE